MANYSKDKSRIAVTTAGLRGTEWRVDRLPHDTKISVHALRTADGASVTGFLFRRGGERTVVCCMHPRELVVPSYVVPEIVSGGCAVWVQGSRSPGNDLRLEHETALLDLAAGQLFLREEEAFENAILLGMSGGGPLAAFYCQQASLPVSDRIKHAPGGRPVALETSALPVPDAVIFLSAHPGQGVILMNAIDPAVIDEADPLRSDDSISAFNRSNGFRMPPESSSYSADFVSRYRQAQGERVQRIDTIARQHLERKAEARARKKQGGTQQDAILAAHTPIFQVWRTDADLRFFDLSLDPSDRAYGSLWGADPFVSNYGSVGFARSCTAESWLSNWSALSSNATMRRCAPDLRQPVLMIEYTGDNCVFPGDADQIFEWIGSGNKTRFRVQGNHHGQTVVKGGPDGQIEAGALMRSWLEERGFA